MLAARDKDVTLALLRAFDLPFTIASEPGGGGFAANAWELAVRSARLLSLARGFRADALVGPSASFGLIGKLIGRPSFVFCEDDASVVPFFSRLAYPLATHIVTPDCLAFENHGLKQLTYPGYHELAYLHPAHFMPDPAVLGPLGLSPDAPFFIVRLVALRGHHDARAQGLAPELARRLVAVLAEHGRVLITSESPLDPELERHRFPLPPEALHDVLAFASLCIGDSQTLIAEAAVLGVPNLRCNSFVGRLAYLEELEKKWGLTRGIAVDDAESLITTAADWLTRLSELKREMQDRRRRMLAGCVDVSDWQWRMLRERLGRA